MRLSQKTITEYLPIIRKIFSVIEMDVHKYDDLDKQDTLTVLMLEKEVGSSRLLYAMSIISEWLKDTDFSVDHFQFTKTKDAPWVNLLNELDNKLVAYANDMPVIEIMVDKNGKLSRKVADSILYCDMTEDGMKLQILKVLGENEGQFILTEDIVKVVGSKNAESVQKQIGTMNKAMAAQLQLPKYSVIEGKSRSGYRIYPLYHLVFLKT